ncbi:hypothetical protein PENSPDRAFT_91848 [Peniophora sp. CONT]|nr:hypothetical protein PENSPDRAFT_91848 [Peniophora sp. CONT]
MSQGTLNLFSNYAEPSQLQKKPRPPVYDHKTRESTPVEPRSPSNPISLSFRRLRDASSGCTFASTLQQSRTPRESRSSPGYGTKRARSPTTTKPSSSSRTYSSPNRFQRGPDGRVPTLQSSRTLLGASRSTETESMEMRRVLGVSGKPPPAKKQRLDNEDMSASLQRAFASLRQPKTTPTIIVKPTGPIESSTLTMRRREREDKAVTHSTSSDAGVATHSKTAERKPPARVDARTWPAIDPTKPPPWTPGSSTPTPTTSQVVGPIPEPSQPASTSTGTTSTKDSDSTPKAIPSPVKPASPPSSSTKSADDKASRPVETADKAVDATAPHDPPRTSQSVDATAPEHIISESAMERLLKLRESSLKSLTEDQLPQELCVDSIRELLGRVAANIVEGGAGGSELRRDAAIKHLTLPSSSTKPSHGKPSHPAEATDKAVDATAAHDAPKPSQSTDATAPEQTISDSAMERLLKLRESSFKVLTENQLPKELRVDNL